MDSCTLIDMWLKGDNYLADHLSKIGFDLVFKSEVESFPSWSKTSNNNNVEKSGSGHSTC